MQSAERLARKRLLKLVWGSVWRFPGSVVNEKRCTSKRRGPVTADQIGPSTQAPGPMRRLMVSRSWASQPWTRRLLAGVTVCACSTYAMWRSAVAPRARLSMQCTLAHAAAAVFLIAVRACKGREYTIARPGHTAVASYLASAGADVAPAARRRYRASLP
jgi:hypothetical protein